MSRQAVPGAGAPNYDLFECPPSAGGRSLTSWQDPWVWTLLNMLGFACISMVSSPMLAGLLAVADELCQALAPEGPQVAPGQVQAVLRSTVLWSLGGVALSLLTVRLARHAGAKVRDADARWRAQNKVQRDEVKDHLTTCRPSRRSGE